MNKDAFIVRIDFRDSADTCVEIVYEMTFKNGGVSFITCDGREEDFDLFEIDNLEVNPLLEVRSRNRTPEE